MRLKEVAILCPHPKSIVRHSSRVAASFSTWIMLGRYRAFVLFSGSACQFVHFGIAPFFLQTWQATSFPWKKKECRVWLDLFWNVSQAADGRAVASLSTTVLPWCLQWTLLQIDAASVWTGALLQSHYPPQASAHNKKYLIPPTSSLWDMTASCPTFFFYFFFFSPRCSTRSIFQAAVMSSCG